MDILESSGNSRKKPRATRIVLCGPVAIQKETLPHPGAAFVLTFSMAERLERYFSRVKKQASALIYLYFVHRVPDFAIHLDIAW
ncbi:MAG: hypothetical protein RL710_987, partial [Pseudomonadota bacterium]